ncbi:hypothetical protein ASF06_16995 [Agreia sp. Leaf244]|nr:hypothetical protein ASF06_16995 [Agreia sp. Leaf244]
MFGSIRAMAQDLWKRPLALVSRSEPERLAWLDADQFNEMIFVREEGRPAHKERATDWEPASVDQTEVLRRRLR